MELISSMDRNSRLKRRSSVICYNLIFTRRRFCCLKSSIMLRWKRDAKLNAVFYKSFISKSVGNKRPNLLIEDFFNFLLLNFQITTIHDNFGLIRFLRNYVTYLASSFNLGFNYPTARVELSDCPSYLITGLFPFL